MKRTLVQREDLKGRFLLKKDRCGATMMVALSFIFVFVLLFWGYIYLMQKTWMVYRKRSYLKEGVVMSAIHLAMYDISRARHKGTASYNPRFYAKIWTSCGLDCYSVVYKIPKEISNLSGSSVSCSYVALEGSNCFDLNNASIQNVVNVKVRYEKLPSGNWLISVEEPQI